MVKFNGHSDLVKEFGLYMQDYAATLLDPQLVGGSTNLFYSPKSFACIDQYGLYTAVLGLVMDNGPIGFSNGLPTLKHDFGYQPYAVIIRPEYIDVVFHYQGNKMKKLDRKLRQLNTMAKDGKLPTLTNFGLPIKWRFEHAI